MDVNVNGGLVSTFWNKANSVDSRPCGPSCNLFCRHFDGSYTTSYRDVATEQLQMESQVSCELKCCSAVSSWGRYRMRLSVPVIGPPLVDGQIPKL